MTYSGRYDTVYVLILFLIQSGIVLHRDKAEIRPEALRNVNSHLLLEDEGERLVVAVHVRFDYVLARGYSSTAQWGVEQRL